MRQNLERVLQDIITPDIAEQFGLVAIVISGSDRPTDLSDLDLDVLVSGQLDLPSLAALEKKLLSGLGAAGYPDVEVFPKIFRAYIEGEIRRAVPQDLLVDPTVVASQTTAAIQGAQWDLVDNSVLNLFLYLTSRVVWFRPVGEGLLEINSTDDWIAWITQIYASLKLTRKGATSWVEMFYSKLFRAWYEHNTRPPSEDAHSERAFLDKLCKSIVRIAFGVYLFHEVLDETDGAAVGEHPELVELRSRPDMAAQPPDTRFYHVLRRYHERQGKESIFSDTAMRILDFAKRVRALEAVDSEMTQRFLDDTQSYVLELTQKLPVSSPMMGKISQMTMYGLYRELGTRLELGRGESIVRKGDPSDAVYFVQTGAVEIKNVRGGRTRKQAGEVFGEFGVFAALPRTADVYAAEDTTLQRLETGKIVSLLSRKEFLENAAERLTLDGQDLQAHYLILSVMDAANDFLLSSDPTPTEGAVDAGRRAGHPSKPAEEPEAVAHTLFDGIITSDGRTFSAHLHDRLLEIARAKHDYFEVLEPPPGEIVVREGHRDDRLYIVDSGSVVVRKGADATMLSELRTAELFGGAVLLNQPSSASVYVGGSGARLLVIRRSRLDVARTASPGIWRLIHYITVIQNVRWTRRNLARRARLGS